MSAVVFYESDNTTLVTTHAFPTTAAGSTSTAWEVHAWLDKGTPGNTLRNLRLAILAEITAGVWAETGTPLVDRQETQIRIIGSENPDNDPAFAARAVTGWQPVGAGSWFTAGDLRGNCCIKLELRQVPSIQAGSGDVATNWKIREITGTAAVGRTDHTGAVGVVTGLGNPDTTEWNDAPTVLQSGTPDALANIGARSWTYAGTDRTQTGETVTLDQDDVAVAALTTGQAYYALLSQDPNGTTVTTTKGAKAAAASAVLPALPAGELPIASVLVHYSATTSVIVTANITVLAVDGRAFLTYSSGSLHVQIGALKALCPTVYVDQSASTDVLLTASETNLVYVSSLGIVTSTILATIPLGGLALWSCVTDGSGVTGTPTDLRVLFSAGLAGPEGPTGSAGTIMLYGTVAPTTEGVDGNFYLDYVASIIYGPKASGTWPSGVSLVGAPGADGSLYATTSVSSIAIATGSKAFTVATGLSFVAGLRVRAASAAGPANFMEGLVASYSGATLTVTVDVTGGSGTKTDWNIGIAGQQGATGAAIGALLTAKGEIATHDGSAAAALTPGANGTIPVYQSGAAKGIVPTGGLVEIARVVCSGSQATVDFGSIPANFQDLEVRYQARSLQTANINDLWLKFNNDGTAGDYDYTQRTFINGTGFSGDSFAPSTAGISVGTITAASTTAVFSGNGVIKINNYLTTTFHKQTSARGQYFEGSSPAHGVELLTAGGWKSLAPLTQLTFSSGTGFLDSSVFVLYGLGAA